MTIRTPVIFDSDCISSFLWVQRLDIIRHLFPKQIIVPRQVVDEIAKLKQFPKTKFVFQILEADIENGEIKQKDIVVPSPEALEYAGLTSMTNPKSIGKGEAASIVLAKSLGGTLASNNLRDILPHVKNGQPPYICTDIILFQAHISGYITLEQGSAIWNEMKSKRRMLPPYDFAEVVRRLEKK